VEAGVTPELGAEVAVTNIPPSSPRRRLEELAAVVAAAIPGVGSATAAAAAVPDGRFGVALRLVCELVPLRPLAEEVRSRIVTAASSAGLGEELGPLDIAIDDLVTAARGQA